MCAPRAAQLRPCVRLSALLFRQEYVQRVPGQQMPPHVYGLANDCYQNMLQNLENQSVVISGESGAGKTEETKQCVQFLAQIARSDTDGTGPEQLLLGSSPILESFGNAKTLKNDNSSRFGKYLEIHFDASGKIVGGRTIKYLLEKSRIVANIGTNERNYHVFYQLAYLSEEAREELKYVGPDGYEYAKKAGCTVVEGLDDKAEFAEVTAAWQAFGLEQEEIMQIYRVVAGVLYLGNVAFEEGADGNSAVENDEVLDPIGELLQAEAEILETTLTMRNMTTGGEHLCSLRAESVNSCWICALAQARSSSSHSPSIKLWRRRKAWRKAHTRAFSTMLSNGSTTWSRYAFGL